MLGHMKQANPGRELNVGIDIEVWILLHSLIEILDVVAVHIVLHQYPPDLTYVGRFNRLTKGIIHIHLSMLRMIMSVGS